jgi:hypothetical protein
MTRERIYGEITTERQCQDARWGGPECDDALSVNDWVAVLARHLGLAASDNGQVDALRYRKQLVRVAATAVAALESFDRVTGREHVAGEHRQGSGF